MNKNNFLIELSESNKTEFGKVDFARQSEKQKVFSAIWVLESEVNNGGFAQYFQNDRGETANFAPTALKRVGANHCAHIVENAIRALTYDSSSMSPDKIESLIAEATKETLEKLDVLSSLFFKYPDNLTDLLFEFVSNHPKVFGSIDAK
jgi:hypothetical protein